MNAPLAATAPSSSVTTAEAPADGFRLHRNAHGRLVLTFPGGTEHAGVTPVRAFPLAAPGEGLSLVGQNGHELAWIDRLDALDAPTRALVEEELAAREFVPSIERILRVSSFSTPSTWEVETDRGPARLVLKAEEDIRRLGSRTALLIAASDGVHFRIQDVTVLDRPSRKLLERFL